MRSRRMTSSRRRVMAAAAAATLPFVLVAAATATAHASTAGARQTAPATTAPEGASASVASPTVSGPVGGGTPAEFMFSTNFNLAQVAYQEQEFFISGTAKSYTSSTPLTTDGVWNNTVPTGATAGYTTRVVVRRPIDPARFNGSVIVEWLNVS